MWVCAGPPSSFPARWSLDLLVLLMVCGFWITRKLKYVFHRRSLRRPRNMASCFVFFKGIAPRWLQRKYIYIYFGVLCNEIHRSQMPPSFLIVNFCCEWNSLHNDGHRHSDVHITRCFQIHLMFICIWDLHDPWEGAMVTLLIWWDKESNTQRFHGFL